MMKILLTLAMMMTGAASAYSTQQGGRHNNLLKASARRWPRPRRRPGKPQGQLSLWLGSASIGWRRARDPVPVFSWG